MRPHSQSNLVSVGAIVEILLADLHGLPLDGSVLQLEVVGIILARVTVNVVLQSILESRERALIGNFAYGRDRLLGTHF